MGWLSMTRAGMGRHVTPKAYLDAQFTYSRTLDGGGTRGMRVIDSAFVGNRVRYAAAEIIQDDEPQYVIALVCLVKWNPKARDGYVFAYKDMEESMGPCEAGSPPGSCASCRQPRRSTRSTGGVAASSSCECTAAGSRTV